MKLLVTGGAGFIGSDFIRYWLEANPGDQIVNLDALTYAGNLANLDFAKGNKNYSFIHGNICDVEVVKKAMAGVDQVVHFAAESHVDRSIENSDVFIRTNVEGTRVLLDVARAAGNIRFHHISTDEVFGALEKDEPKFNENTPYDPRSPYSAAKASSDHLVRAYYHTYNLPITISNCSNNYGPYMFPEKFIALMITNLMTGKKIPVYGDGGNIRDWINVRDHNKGVEKIIKKGKAGKTYCLGGNNELRNIDLANMVLKEMGMKEDMIEFVEDRKGHDWRYAIDFSKAKNELGWQPERDFNVGLKETIKWYQDNEVWWQDILSGKYKEIR